MDMISKDSKRPTYATVRQLSNEKTSSTSFKVALDIVLPVLPVLPLPLVFLSHLFPLPLGPEGLIGSRNRRRQPPGGFVGRDSHRRDRLLSNWRWLGWLGWLGSGDQSHLIASCHTYRRHGISELALFSHRDSHFATHRHCCHTLTSFDITSIHQSPESNSENWDVLPALAAR